MGSWREDEARWSKVVGPDDTRLAVSTVRDRIEVLPKAYCDLCGGKRDSAIRMSAANFGSNMMDVCRECLLVVLEVYDEWRAK